MQKKALDVPKSVVFCQECQQLSQKPSKPTNTIQKLQFIEMHILSFEFIRCCLSWSSPPPYHRQASTVWPTLDRPRCSAAARRRDARSSAAGSTSSSCSPGDETRRRPLSAVGWCLFGPKENTSALLGWNSKSLRGSMAQSVALHELQPKRAKTHWNPPMYMAIIGVTMTYEARKTVMPVTYAWLWRPTSFVPFLRSGGSKARPEVQRHVGRFNWARNYPYGSSRTEPQVRYDWTLLVPT